MLRTGILLLRLERGAHSPIRCDFFLYNVSCDCSNISNWRIFDRDSGGRIRKVILDVQVWLPLLWWTRFLLCGVWSWMCSLFQLSQNHPTRLDGDLRFWRELAGVISYLFCYVERRFWGSFVLSNGSWSRVVNQGIWSDRRGWCCSFQHRVVSC